MSLKSEELKDMTYYIVDVALRNSNPIHRTIIHHRHSNIADFLDYEYKQTFEVEELPYFRVVQELSIMKEKFPERFYTPKMLRKEGI